MPMSRIAAATPSPHRVHFDLPPPSAAPRENEPSRLDTRSRAPRLGRLLVATDGSPTSRGALLLARHLAARHRATVHVLSVIDRWSSSRASDDFAHLVPQLAAQRLFHVRPQVEQALGSGVEWTLRVVDGPVVPTIRSIAEGGAFDLLLVGMRAPWLRRLQPRPTAAAVAESSRVPVLAVPSTVTSIPTRALVHIDRETGSLAAARTALHVLEPGAAAQLVHVPSRRRVRPEAEVFVRDAHDPAALFYAFERALDGHHVGESAPPSLSRFTLSAGDPAQRLAEHARAAGVDLITFGSRPPAGLSARLWRASGRRLLRAAHCSVLLAGSRDQAASGPR